MKRWIALLALLLTGVASAQTTVIRNVNVRIGGQYLSRQVELQGSKITKVDKEIKAASGASIVDARGGFLLPGFIDCHVHLALVDPAAVVRNGVTTVRDLGDPIKLLERLAASPPELAPSVEYSGGMLTCPGGYPEHAGWAPAGTALIVPDTKAAQDIVSRLVLHHARCVKVTLEPGAGPTLSPAILSSIVQAAHQAGLRVAAHISTVAELEKAISGGVDDLAHGLFDDSLIPAALLGKMVERKVSFCPTLHIRATAPRLRNLGDYYRMGGIIVYGTDMGNNGPPPGIDVVELKLMVQAGMSISMALDSATSIAAKRLGLDDRGVIKPGARADLALFSGDPYSNLDNLRGLVGVWHLGKRVR